MIKKRQLKTRPVCKVSFELPATIDAHEVQLIADFTDWQPLPFQKRKDGSWKLEQELEPNRRYEFRYRLLNDRHSEYLNDPEANATVANPYGSDNAVLVC